MQNSSDQQNNSPYQPITIEEAKLWFAWAALVTGAILLLFAEPISFELVKEKVSGNGYTWSLNNVRDTAFNLRIGGGALLFAGYMERLIMRISALKP